MKLNIDTQEAIKAITRNIAKLISLMTLATKEEVEEKVKEMTKSRI